MANPTTNYGFVMPTNTDLVKDLPADFDVFGQAVDTQMKTNADAAIAKNIVDAKGDIIVATGSDAVSRLAVGANDTVLTADSSTATGLKWAAAAGGGMTLISTTALSGASVTLSSIPQTYNSLFLLIYGVTNATADSVFAVEANNDFVATYTAIVNGTAEVNSNSLRITGATNPLRTDANNVWQVRFDNYTSTTNYKAVSWSGVYISSGPTNTAVSGGGGWKSNSAITSLVIKNYGGNLSTGEVKLYGVK